MCTEALDYFFFPFYIQFIQFRSTDQMIRFASRLNHYRNEYFFPLRLIPLPLSNIRKTNNANIPSIHCVIHLYIFFVANYKQGRKRKEFQMNGIFN